jgi:predicted AlkP superfamily phosphohydrolase/phosphomutase
VVISLDGFPAYVLEDPRLPIPTLRKLASEGAVAAAMQPVNPTVTWPNHTTMVTGVDAAHHQVVVNGLLTRNTDGSISIEPWRNKDLLVHARTVYDAAYEAGLTTAQVDWVAIYGARTITWSFPEQPDPNSLIEGQLVSAGLVTRDQLANFDDSSPAWQDEIPDGCRDRDP